MVDPPRHRLRRHLSFAPPATPEQLTSLEAALGHPLPTPVRRLLEDHGGVVPEWGHPDSWIRLMTPDEAAAATVDQLVGWAFDEDEDRPTPVFVRSETALFWTDDNGNYLGVFTEGPFQGCVFVLDHEEPLPVPVWESVESFYDALLGFPDDEFLFHRDLARDFPRGAGAAPDRWDAVATALFDRHGSQPATSAGLRAAYQALAVSSPALAERVRELRHAADQHVRTEALRTLVRWDLAELDELIDAVRSGSLNEQLLAMAELRRIGDDRGLRAVAERLGAYWAAVDETSPHSPLHRVPGLDAGPAVRRAFWNALWWAEQRLWHHDHGARELHSAAGGMTAAQITTALDRSDLPEPHLADGVFSGLAVSVSSDAPLTLAVPVPFWWTPGVFHLVADLRLVWHDDRFAVAIDALRAPRVTQADGSRRHVPGDAP